MVNDDPSMPNSQENGISVPLVAGIAGGACFFIAIIVILVIVLLRQRAKNAQLMSSGATSARIGVGDHSDETVSAKSTTSEYGLLTIASPQQSQYEMGNISI